MRRIFRAILLIGLAALALATAVVLLLRPLTGRDYVKDFFVYQLEQNLGRKLDVRVVRLVVLPSIRLELKDAVIYEPDGRTVFVKARRIDTVLRFWPLLKRQVVGKRLLIDSPTIDLRRDAAGIWNVAAITPSTSGARSAHRPTDWLMYMKETTIENGTIRITDEARPDGLRTASFQNLQAKIQVDADRARGEVSISATMPGDPGASALSLTGAAVQVANPARFASDDPSQVASVLQFDGTIQATNVPVRQIADFLGPRPLPDELRGNLDLRGQIHAVPGVVGYDLVFQDVVGRLEKLALRAKANLSGMLSSQPTLSITFNTSPVTLDALLTYIPAKWIHPALPGLIAERQIAGIVEVAGATLIASTEPRPQFGVTGEFRITEGQALLGDGMVRSENLAGTVFIEPGRLRIPSFSGDYGTLHIGHGKVLVSFLEAGPWLELDLTGDMTAADLVTYLARSIQSPRVSRFLASVRNIQGSAVPTFRLVGALNQPGGITFVGGEVQTQDLSFDTTALPSRVEGVEGRLRFSQSGTTFDEIAGRLGPSRFRINGTVTAGGSSAFEDFTVQMTGETSHLIQFLPTSAVPTVSSFLQGPVAMSLSLSGLADTPHLRAQTTLTGAALKLPWIGEKPPNIPAQLEAEGDMTSKGLVVKQLDIVLNPLRLGMKGKILLGDRFIIDASLATGIVSLSSLPEWLNRGGLEAGNMEVSLDVKGTQPEWTTWTTSGWVALTNGLMTMKGVDGQIHDLYLRLKLVRHGAELKQLTFKVLDSDVTVSGTIRNWDTKPVLSAKIESSRLDIDLLIPKEGRSPFREFLELLAEKTQTTATASIERGFYKRTRVVGLTARINIENGVLDVDRINARAEGGHLSGRLVVRLPKEQPAEAEATIRLAGVPFEELSHLTGTREHFMTGDVHLTGTIRGHGRNPHGLFPTLAGDAEVSISGGRIFKSQKRAIWKILGILNLPAVLQSQIDLEKDGLPFDKLTGTFVMRNGLLDAQRILIDSPVVKLSVAGTYDLPTDQLDMVYAVSPFGSYSKMIQNVPLFGRFFAGDRTGIATAFFQAKGALDDPEVTYMPMKSFTEGLNSLATLAYDVLRNTFRMPKEFLTNEPDAPPSGESGAPLGNQPDNLY